MTAAWSKHLFDPDSYEATLVLLTVDHADLAEPLRFTSDGVTTSSNGNPFSPLFFEVVLPDQAEGKQPRAVLRIDNTSTEIVQALRSLQTAPTVTIQIVIASDPDTIHKQYAAMKVLQPKYTSSFIDFPLAAVDYSQMTYPFLTFEASQWPALF